MASTLAKLAVDEGCKQKVLQYVTWNTNPRPTFEKRSDIVFTSHLIAELAHESHLLPQILQLDIVGLLLALYEMDNGILELACDALSHLALHADGPALIVEGGGVQLIMNLCVSSTVRTGSVRL